MIKYSLVFSFISFITLCFCQPATSVDFVTYRAFGTVVRPSGSRVSGISVKIDFPLASGGSFTFTDTTNREGTFGFASSSSIDPRFLGLARARIENQRFFTPITREESSIPSVLTRRISYQATFPELILPFSQFARRTSYLAESMGSGSLTPLEPGVLELQNNDFLIKSDFSDQPVGDGSNETTTWEFDFSESITSISPIDFFLRGAFLNLTLKNRTNVETDLLQIDILEPINVEDINGFSTESQITQNVSINLLNFYSSNTLLSVFNRNQGRIPVTYRDDAIISNASLRLTTEKTSEPSTIIAFITVNSLVFVLRYKKRVCFKLR